MATPVLRVAASVSLFAAERGLAYAAITSAVLLLVLSFLIGAAE